MLACAAPVSMKYLVKTYVCMYVRACVDIVPDQPRCAQGQFEKMAETEASQCCDDTHTQNAYMVVPTEPSEMMVSPGLNSHIFILLMHLAISSSESPRKSSNDLHAAFDTEICANVEPPEEPDDVDLPKDVRRQSPAWSWLLLRDLDLDVGLLADLGVDAALPVRDAERDVPGSGLGVADLRVLLDER